MTAEDFLHASAYAGIGLLTLAVALGFLRLARGPGFADRVVALDMMTVIIVSFSGLYAVLTDDTAFIDILVVLALVGFLTMVALARFAERRMAEESGGDARRAVEGAPDPLQPAELADPAAEKEKRDE